MKSFIISGLMATAALSIGVPNGLDHFDCGAPKPSLQLLDTHKAMSKMEAIAHPILAKANIVVNVYVHIVAASRSVSDGYVSDATIADQIKVLNDNYAPSGISFVFKTTDRTINPDWSNDPETYEYDMKSSLRKGTYKDLNLYYTKSIGKYLGYCHFPTNASDGDEDFEIDGCTIVASSMPGNAGQYGLGKTTTHEVGHWFGLLHTFQGGCNGGDSVADTPAQASASRGCPTGRDSCPNDPGLDPIHNYMDYSSE